MKRKLGITIAFLVVIVIGLCYFFYSKNTIEKDVEARLRKYDREINFLSSLVPLYNEVEGTCWECLPKEISLRLNLDHVRESLAGECIKQYNHTIKARTSKIKELLEQVPTYDESSEEIVSSFQNYISRIETIDDNGKSSTDWKESFVNSFSSYCESQLNSNSIIKAYVAIINEEIKEVNRKYQNRFEYNISVFCDMETLYKGLVIKRLRKNRNFNNYFESGDIQVGGLMIEEMVSL